MRWRWVKLIHDAALWRRTSAADGWPAGRPWPWPLTPLLFLSLQGCQGVVRLGVAFGPTEVAVESADGVVEILNGRDVALIWRQTWNGDKGINWVWLTFSKEGPPINHCLLSLCFCQISAYNTSIMSSQNPILLKLMLAKGSLVLTNYSNQSMKICMSDTSLKHLGILLIDAHLYHAHRDQFCAFFLYFQEKRGTGLETVSCSKQEW